MKPATSLKPGHNCADWVFKVLVAFGWLALSLTACSHLPPAALPQPLTDEDSFAGEVLTYRQLAKHHFLATRPPPHLDHNHPALAAHAAILLRLQPSARFVAITEAGEELQSFCVKAQGVRFEAVLLPDRSWWNPEVEDVKSQLVLQHEQVHFALMEASARRLNQRVAREHEGLRSCGEDHQQAKQSLVNRLNAWLTEEEQRVRADHGAFDSATSRLHAPQIQQWWYDRLMRDLSRDYHQDR